jgi:hypothetical protein
MGKYDKENKAMVVLNYHEQEQIEKRLGNRKYKRGKVVKIEKRLCGSYHPPPAPRPKNYPGLLLFFHGGGGGAGGGRQ